MIDRSIYLVQVDCQSSANAMNSGHRPASTSLRGPSSLKFFAPQIALSPMVTSQNNDPPRLPQELFDLIVDEVARLKPVLDSRAALRACALVSRSFSHHSRKHLWGDLVFCMDASYRKRATELIHMLRRKDNTYLVSHVRSIQLVFDTSPSGDEKRYQHTKGILKTAIKRTFRRYFKPRCGVLDVLQKINNPNFEHFSVISRGRASPVHWTQDKFSKVMKPSLLQVLSSNSNIKCFALCNIGSISKQLAAAAFFSPAMEDLTMRNLQFGRDQFVTLVVERPRVLVDLRRLEMINVPISPLLSFILELVPHSRSSNSVSSSNFTSDMELYPLFPRLQTLVVSVPHSEDMYMLWRFVLGGASSLENLEMEYHHRSTPDCF